jgi:hypothetical protein
MGRMVFRNKQPFWYALYDSTIEDYDEYGNQTGTSASYGEVVKAYGNISAAQGEVAARQFGDADNYDKVIFTRDTDCPIDENTVLFVEKAPEYTEIQTHEIIEGNALFADDEIVTVTYRQPKFDYIVKRVAKSLNGVLIAISKVKVS